MNAGMHFDFNDCIDTDRYSPQIRRVSRRQYCALYKFIIIYLLTTSLDDMRPILPKMLLAVQQKERSE